MQVTDNQQKKDRPHVAGRRSVRYSDMAYHTFGAKSVLSFVKGVGYILVAAGVLFVALPMFCEWINERYGEGSARVLIWILLFIGYLIDMGNNRSGQYPDWVNW
jgi:hypothetical protein